MISITDQQVLEALAAYLQAQDDFDNHEAAGINGEDYFVLLRRRNRARDDLDNAMPALRARIEGGGEGVPAGLLIKQAEWNALSNGARDVLTSTLRFGGCPSCGRSDCVAGQCRRRDKPCPICNGAGVYGTPGERCQFCRGVLAPSPPSTPEPAGRVEAAAWMHVDDPRRVISAMQKDDAMRDGVASASSVSSYSIPLIHAHESAPTAPQAVELSEADVVRIARESGTPYVNRFAQGETYLGFSEKSLLVFARAVLAKAGVPTKETP